MSCVKWHIGILGTSPSFGVSASTCPDMRCELMSSSPRFEVGVLCKAGLERWLEVTPDEVAWLTEANDWSYDYEVSSNLKWTIE